jgi:hypothetical protein
MAEVREKRVVPLACSARGIVCLINRHRAGHPESRSFFSPLDVSFPLDIS